MQSCQIITLDGQLNKYIPLHIVRLKNNPNGHFEIVVLYSGYDYLDCVCKFNTYKNSYSNNCPIAIVNCLIDDFNTNIELIKNIVEFYHQNKII